MKPIIGGGRHALRGFSYQLLYSALRSTYMDLSNYSTIGNEISAKFIFEGYSEQDLIVSYPEYTEHIEIKSRRSRDNFWRLHELALILKHLFRDFNSLSNDVYTFVTDGRLDDNCSRFYLVCGLIKQLKDLDRSNDAIMATLANKHFCFRSRAAIWGRNGLEGSVAELLTKLLAIFTFPNNGVLFEALSRIRIIDNYSESSIEQAIVGMLKQHVPQETIKSTINQLLAQILKIAKNPPTTISRDSLFKAVGVPTIPLVTPMVKRACLQLTFKHASHNTGLTLHEGIRRPRFERAFSDFMRDEEHNMFLLSGDSGVGKTMSCIRLAHLYSNILPTVYVPAERCKNDDPIEFIGRGISLELGRSDTLPLRTIISKLNENMKRSSFLIIFDGIDSLTTERFAHLLFSVRGHCAKMNLKVLFSCKREKLDRYVEEFRTLKLYRNWKEGCTVHQDIDSFRLADYDQLEFAAALRYYGYGVSVVDDDGNDRLYERNKHLHRPLYLSIFSQVSSKDTQYPPSLGVNAVFEAYFEKLILSIAQECEDYPTPIINDLIWNILVAVAKQTNDSVGPSTKDIIQHLSIKNDYLISEIHAVISKLLNAGIIYDNKLDAKKKNKGGLLVLLSTGRIRFFHEEIGEWVLAFDIAREISNKGEDEICEAIKGSRLSMENALALGIMHRSNPEKYNNIILSLLEHVSCKDAVWGLISALHAPDRTLIRKIMQVLKDKDPNHLIVLSRLASLFFSRGVESNAMSLGVAAIKEFETALEIADHIEDDSLRATTKASIFNNLSVSYKTINMIPKAIELLNKSIELDPGWHSYFNLADIEFSLHNDYERALAFFEKAIQFKGQVRYGKILLTLNSKAVCLFRLGRIQEACQIWEDVLSQCEGVQYLHQHAICRINANIGDGMFRLKNYSRAISHFLRVLGIDEFFEFRVTIEALIYLIASYLRTGESRQAKTWLDRYRHLIGTDVLTESLTTYDILEYRSLFEGY